MDGIGDTMRVSLANPVERGAGSLDMLKSLRLRSKGINFIACPSCSRQNFDVVKTMNELETRLEDIKTPMGCGRDWLHRQRSWRSQRADLGLTGASPSNLIYIDGQPDHKIGQDNLVDNLKN